MSNVPRLESSFLVQVISQLRASIEENMKFAGLVPGTLRGEVVDVNDPKGLGRVKVVLDPFNKEIPQVTGAGEWSKERRGKKPDRSHWIDVSPSFKGKQPESLVGKRVNISITNGEIQYAVVQDVLFDPPNSAKGKGKNLKMPNNSTMTRLPIYEAGSLPEACEENHGCMVVEMGGPMESDWLCVCLQRQGDYYWVRHIDMAHGHAGENDGKQGADTDGNAQQPVQEQSIWDYVFPTTGGEMQKYSQFGTSPRPNPFGGEAKWHKPPK